MREKYVVYRGDTLPSPNEFEEGDLFLEVPTQTLWMRQGGAWVSIASPGGLTDLQNVGTGSGEIYQGLAGTIANLRTLRHEGGLLRITTAANEVNIHGAVITDDPAGTGISLLGWSAPYDPFTAFLKTIVKGSGALRITETMGDIIFDGAEFNNVGAGVGFFRDITGDNQVNLRSLVSGDGSVAIVENPDEVDLSVDVGAAGGVTDGANVGGGVGEVYRDKTGSTLNFRTLENAGAGDVRVLRGVVGDQVVLRRLTAGSNITLTENADDIVIASSGAFNSSMTSANIAASSASGVAVPTGSWNSIPPVTVTPSDPTLGVTRFSVVTIILVYILSVSPSSGSSVASLLAATGETAAGDPAPLRGGLYRLSGSQRIYAANLPFGRWDAASGSGYLLVRVPFLVRTFRVPSTGNIYITSSAIEGYGMYSALPSKSLVFPRVSFRAGTAGNVNVSQTVRAYVTVVSP